MSEKNKAMIRRFYDEYVNQGKQSLVDELVAEDFTDHNPGLPDIVPGREGMKQVFATFRSAFPDMRMTVEDQIAEGDKVVSRLRASGTHLGDFMGMPATGKSFSITIIDILSIKGGKINEHWGESDDMGMLQQLGVIPTP